MVEAIASRREIEAWNEAALVEWQTKQLAWFISATVPVDKGKKNPLFPYVEDISLRPRSEEEKAADREPDAGSYEKFMSQFGPAMG